PPRSPPLGGALGRRGPRGVCEQLSTSVQGGAAGFIAGRSLWKESVGMAPDERRAFLAGTVRRRFEELLSLLDRMS
ncbi:MAG: hypothetical protein M3N56_09165, partial [Actinomycetota bacterium]|nr:hypothetical protein [Actinomycetota bacterium]